MLIGRKRAKNYDAEQSNRDFSPRIRCTVHNDARFALLENFFVTFVVTFAASLIAIPQSHATNKTKVRCQRTGRNL